MTNINKICNPKYLIIIFPLTWFAGVHVLIFPIVIIGLFLVIPVRIEKLNLAEILMFLFCLFALFRVLFVFLEGDVYRGAASFYNWGVLATSFIFYIQASKNSRFLHNVVDGFSLLFPFIFLSYFAIYIYSLVTGNYQLEHSSLLGVYVGQRELPGILEAAKDAVYTRYDWGLGIALPRIVFLAEFPTSAALLVALSYNFYSLKRNIYDRFSLLIITDIFVATIIACTLSRVTFITFILASLFSYLFVIPGKKKMRKYMPFFFLIILAPLFFIFLNYSIDLMQYRQGSANARLESYSMGLDYVLTKNPFFGIGIKPYSPVDINIPVGSHSTIISIFVKHGFFGILLFSPLILFYPIKCFLKSSFRDLKTNIDIFIIRTVPIIISWILFQDIDAYVMPALLVFSSFSIYKKESIN